MKQSLPAPLVVGVIVVAVAVVGFFVARAINAPSGSLPDSVKQQFRPLPKMPANFNQMSVDEKRRAFGSGGGAQPSGNGAQPSGN